MKSLAARIDDALPQTQCTRCGYADCAAYAQAIAHGEAGIDQCPPGGAEGVARLARITDQPTRALNPQFGMEAARGVAVIDEAWCIGCTLCLQACPTDAIMGAHKRMHTVIEAYCTGCELCIPPCPVDCISMEEATPGRSGWAAWSAALAEQARERYALHRARQDMARTEAPSAIERVGATAPENAPVESKAAAAEAATAQRRKQATIEAALAKARARRDALPPPDAKTP